MPTPRTGEKLCGGKGKGPDGVIRVDEAEVKAHRRQGSSSGSSMEDVERYHLIRRPGKRKCFLGLDLHGSGGRL
jgi:hypothetical protein